MVNLKSQKQLFVIAEIDCDDIYVLVGVLAIFKKVRIKVKILIARLNEGVTIVRSKILRLLVLVGGVF